MMFIRCPIPDIMQIHPEVPHLLGAVKNAGIQVRGENFWKESKNVKLHVPILAERELLRK